MKKRILLLAALALYLPWRSAGQSAPDDQTNLSSNETRQSMMSKNGAANLSGLYNVDLYSGTASVNIPIYSYSVNNLDLSVSLGYSNGGIRVDDRASCVGLGWDISSGGYITREVHGIEDEAAIPAARPGWNDTVYYGGRWISGAESQEKEYDLFTAVFAGRTLRFEVTDPVNGRISIKTNPRSGVSIVPWISHCYLRNTIQPGGDTRFNFAGVAVPPGMDSSADRNILNFTLYDEYGNTFVFTRGAYERKEVPNNAGGTNGSNGVNPPFLYYPPTRWNLTRVTTAAGLTVDYTYTELPAFYNAYRIENIKETSIISGSSYVEDAIVRDTIKTVKWEGVVSRLSKIEYPNGVTVDLSYRTDFDQHRDMINPLDKVTISSGYDGNVKHRQSYQLHYSFFQSPWKNYTLPPDISYDTYNNLLLYYFNRTSGETFPTVHEQVADGLRLKLDKISTTGDDGQESHDVYSFNYELQRLPRRLDPGRDYYGFANGKQAIVIPSVPPFSTHSFLSNLAIPQHTFKGIAYGVDKTPDFNYTRACLLQSIQTAAGGNITFLYKPHRLYNPQGAYCGTDGLPVTYPAYEGEDANDGVCIDEIVLTDGFNNDNTTRTRYEFERGQRFMRGGLSWYGWVSYDISSKMYTNNFVGIVPFVNGANHGYSYATVKSYGYDYQLLGSTKYHFTNLLLESDTLHSNLKIDTRPVYNVSPVDYFYPHRMGRLLDVTSYDPAGYPVSSTAYSYEDSTDRTNAQTVYGSNFNVLSFPNGQRTYHSFYSIPFRVRNRTVTTYANNGNLVKSVDYTYDNTDKVRTATWLDEFSDPNVKTYYYNYHYGQLNNYLPRRTELTRTVNGTEYLVDLNTTDYDWMLDANSNSHGIRLLQTGRLTNGAMEIPQWGVISPSYMARKSPNTRVQQRITAYDSKSNPVEVKAEDKEQYTASVWDTRIGQKVAEADNAKYADIAYTSFEGVHEPRGTADDNKGNWDFTQSQVIYAAPNAANQPMTGHYYYQMDGAGIDSKNALTAGKKYLVTCWASGMPSVSGATLATGPALHQQKGSWGFYSMELTGTGSAIHIAGNSLLMDELRLYPADAAMTTTTYEPLFGPGSQADAQGNINYYEYDGLGRQTVVRDIDHNVLSVTRQVLHGADIY